MALFNRDYDRDYGYRTGRSRAGQDRDMGDRARGGWNNLKQETRGFFGGGYDRDYNRSDRGYGTTGYRNDPGYRSTGMYDRDYDRTDRANRGFWGTSPTYDRDYREYGYGTTGAGRGGGYDRNYKSRQQTDYGDPFGDRQSRTPIRMMRGEYEGGYDSGFRGGSRDNRNRGYDRDYGANPMGYDPYYGGGYNRNY